MQRTSISEQPQWQACVKDVLVSCKRAPGAHQRLTHLPPIRSWPVLRLVQPPSPSDKYVSPSSGMLMGIQQISFTVLAVHFVSYGLGAADVGVDDCAGLQFCFDVAGCAGWDAMRRVSRHDMAGA